MTNQYMLATVDIQRPSHRRVVDYTSMVVRYIQAQPWQRDRITLTPTIDWHPTSSLLASDGKDQLVKLLDARTRRKFSSLRGHKSTVVLNVKLDKNGNWLLTTSKNEIIKLYDIKATQELESFLGLRKNVTSLAWYPFDRKYFVGGSNDGSICRWTVGCENPQIEIPSAYDNNIWDWHPLGSLLCSGRNDHTTRFWCRNRPADNPTDAAVSTMQNQAHIDYTSTVVKYIQARTWQRDSRDRITLQPTRAAAIDLLPTVAYSDNPSISFAAKFVSKSLNKKRCSTNRVLWTPSGSLITGSQSGEFNLWNGQFFNFERTIQAHDQPIRSMVWSYNDSWMLSGDDGGTLKYWQNNMNNVAKKIGHEKSIRDLSFCKTDLKFCSCSDDTTIKVWDFDRFQEERSLTGHRQDVNSVDWHPTNSLLVSGGKDQFVKLWDARTGRELSTIHGRKNMVLSVKWNQNGNWFLTASKDQIIKLYDIRAIKEFKSFRGYMEDVTSLAWHPFHEEYFVSGSHDGSICHWIVGHENPQTEISCAHSNSVWDLAWHPMGHLLCSGSNDCTTKFWCRNRPVGKPKAAKKEENKEIYADNTDPEVIKIGGRNNREKNKQPNELKKKAAETRSKTREAQPVPEEPIPIRDYGDGSIVRLDWEHGNENLFGPILFQEQNDCWALALRAILQFKVNEGVPIQQQVDLGTEGLIESLKEGEVDLALGSLNAAIRYIREKGLEKKGGRRGPYAYTKTGDFRVLHEATEKEIVDLLQNGPVAIVIDGDYAFTNLKKKEIYYVKKSKDDKLDVMKHVTKIIGHGKLEDGTIFFIVRNTWGITWADKGYGRIVIKDCAKIVYLNE